MSALPPDPHLQAALRHAPDADLAAPPALSAQILAAAHRSATQQAAPGAEGGARPGFRAWWPRHWTAWTSAGPRAALATLLMAGFVGLLWRGETPGPAVDGAAPTRMAAAPPAGADVGAAAESTAVPAAASATPSVAPARTPDAAPATAPATPISPRPRAALPSGPASDERRTPAPAAARTAAQALASPPAPSESPAVPAGVPPPAPLAPAGSGLADAGGKPTLLPMRPDAAESADPAVAVAASPSPVAPAPVHRSARLSAPPVVASATALPTAPTLSVAQTRAAPPWGEAAMAADRWQRAGSAPGAVDLAGLRALAAASQGRWLPAPGAQPAEGALMLVGLLGDTEQGRLWLETGAVLWCPAAGTCQRAVLAEGQAQGLRARLLR
jgi:hypothetical protein